MTARKDNTEESIEDADAATQQPQYVNWLSDPDMLPSQIPRARIMAFNHDSQWYGEDAVSLRLDPLASSLQRAIIDERKVTSLWVKTRQNTRMTDNKIRNVRIVR